MKLFITIVLCKKMKLDNLYVMRGWNDEFGITMNLEYDHLTKGI